MKADRLNKKSIRKKNSESERNVKRNVVQIWNEASDKIEYYSSSKLIRIAFFILVAFGVSSCVSKKALVGEQYKSSQYQKDLIDCERDRDLLSSQNRDLSGKLILLENKVANEESKTNILDQQVSYYQSTNTNLLDRLSDMSVVSKTGAESIRKSLDAINDQNKYIKDLTSAMRAKDSINLALVMKLKRSLVDINDEDVTVEVKKGVVYISLSDKMLFQSGKYEINKQAEVVLEKIARVLNDHRQLDILVEGHTDDVPISTPLLVDNWDLSVKRATSIVRVLQTKYGIAPERMTAGGRSEFIPKTSNSTVEGRAANRRTEIIIMPKLDEFFQLLEPEASN